MSEPGKHPGLRRAGRWTVAAGLAVLVSGVVILLWPLDATGVSGTALSPHYRDFGRTVFAPLPDQPSFDDFRRAGVRVPQDVVAHRRHLTELLSVIGVTVIAGGSLAILASRRRRRT